MGDRNFGYCYFLRNIDGLSDDSDRLVKLGNGIHREGVWEEGFYYVLKSAPVGITKVKAGVTWDRWREVREVTLYYDWHVITPYVLSYGEVLKKREEPCIAECEIDPVRVTVSKARMGGGVVIQNAKAAGSYEVA